MNTNQIYACQTCGVLLDKSLMKEINKIVFCYFCARRYSNKINKEDIENEDK